MRRRLLLLATSLATVFGLVPGLAPVAAHAATPGGVFITGHDPDFHALVGANTTGSRNLIRRGVEYVTFGAASPTMLLVSSRISPPAGHVDSAIGLSLSGYSFDIAAAPGQGVLDLNTVDFNAYDVIVVASDFGGILRQAELDILNARSSDVISYINNGGGLVAFAESNNGSHLTPAGGHFDYLPFLATENPFDQPEFGNTVTPFGASLGITNADVNGNASHNIFTGTGGMEVVDIDDQSNILTLAARGICFSPGGVPSVSVADADVVEGNVGATNVDVTVSLSTANACSDVTVNLATTDGTAAGGTDYLSAAPQVTIPAGSTSTTASFTVNGDNAFEADETFLVNVVSTSNSTIADGQGVVTILNDDSPNGAPDCSSVAPSQAQLWPPDHTLRTVSLSGGTDPDGDAVILTITGVTQDEAVNDKGDGTTAPDAAAGPGTSAVQLRAERSGRGDGRVYRIAYSGSDGNGGSCLGTVYVTVPHSQNGDAAVDSGAAYNSFAT